MIHYKYRTRSHKLKVLLSYINDINEIKTIIEGLALVYSSDTFLFKPFL